MTETDFLWETNKKHSDMVDSFAYMVASQVFKYKENYTLMYIKKKPKYLPAFIYKWILKKVLIMAEFKL
jgi:hypothetical protein